MRGDKRNDGNFVLASGKDEKEKRNIWEKEREAVTSGVGFEFGENFKE